MGRGGLEPPTSRLSGVRSNHLSYRPDTISSAGSSDVQARHSRHLPVAFSTQNSPPDCFALQLALEVVVKGYEDGLAAF